MKDFVELMREAARTVELTFPKAADALYKGAADLDDAIIKQKDKLEFMVEMTKLDHNIDMDDNGEFKSELTNAMFVGWMVKVNKK